ncbi:50S ribosomal protein L29 [Candidatus Jorgensenbacteria bacterium GWA1_54_12]|uniref:Large ribosomal subunit protein uL29 n=1 Tax=Candidatus Jorgensenbacteria bacterium GWA1_54_12 TaxID=1798468 RepID=A0A1F6BL59_9BACT|nr:MAG: 50S ribosomal protein L29 [Candidatus Jorgensenbacteria bacterium GWA1_54_12]
MKKREYEKVRALPREELMKRLATEQERLRTLRFDLSLGKVSNVRDLIEAKRMIARLMTILNQHENV